jgi:uncharacterized repeat protein (TIGR01451 family)
MNGGGVVEKMEVVEQDGIAELLAVLIAPTVDDFDGYLYGDPEFRFYSLPYFSNLPEQLPHINGNNDFLLASSFDVYDWDADGDDDVLLASSEGNWIERTESTFIVRDYNDAHSLFGARIQGVYDYNQDGLPDQLFTAGVGYGVLANNFWGERSGVDIFVGLVPGKTGAAPFGQSQMLYPSTAYSVNDVVDADGDGDQDLLSWKTQWGDWAKDSLLYVLENDSDSILYPRQLTGFPGLVEQLQFEHGDSIGFVLVSPVEEEDGVITPLIKDQLYMIRKEGSGWSAPFLVVDSMGYYDFKVGDVDNDGDPDIFYIQYLEPDIIRSAWYENTGTGSMFTEHILINDTDQPGSFYNHFSKLIDINGDGLLDIFLRGPFEYIYFLQQPTGEFDFTQPTIFTLDDFYYIWIDDFDEDGDADILGRTNGQQGACQLGLYPYDANTQQYGGFEASQEVVCSVDYKVGDFDSDGDLDVITDDGVCLNIAASGIFSAPSGGDAPFYPDYSIVKHLGDLNGDGKADLISLRSNYIPNKGWNWQENFTTPEFVFVQGTVLYDEDTDCQDMALDTLPYTSLQPKLQWENNYNNSEVISTNSEANYLVALPDTGQHLWNLIPPSAVWQSCPEDTLQTYTVYDSVYTLDFQLQPLENCPFIDVSMVVGLLRGCEDGTIYLDYKNTGTIPSQNQLLHFTHEEGLTIVNTSIPPLAQTDTLITFELPPLDVGASGQIEVVVNPSCAVYLPGHVFCFDAVVEQDISCLDNLDDWDGSDLRAEATCEQDSIVFTLKNEGPGAMDMPRQYSLSIVNDDIIMLKVDDVLLGPEDSILLKVKDTTELIRLIAAQDDGHPEFVELQMTVDGCLTPDSSNILNQQLLQSPNTNYGLTGVQACRALRGAYDPNIKEAFPVGEGPDHEIRAGSWIDYTVHFQNTGNDTAFLVVLRDTLPECLDLTTLRMGTSSHPYEWVLHENRELSITFDPIALPDSNVNVLGSQGFVHYSIKIPDDCLPGTEIKNRAGIYFDFNPVVLTDYTLHTIQKPVVYNDELVVYCLESGPAVADSLETITYSYPYYDSLVLVQHKFVVPDTNYLALEIAPGTIWEGIEIVTDTTITWIMENEYGCDSLLIYEFNIVSTQELQQAKLIVFPNPVSEQLFVHIPNFTSGYHLELYEARGSMVWQGAHRRAHAGVHEVMIPVQELPDGIYSLRLKGDQGQQASTRVVVRR